MEAAPCSQYRSDAARDECFAYLDAQAAREWPVPSQARTVPTSFGPTFVRISGPDAAPRLVLLPGVATSSLMWAPNIAALSADYRTFAVDRIGDFGRSICTRPLRNFNDLVLWLAEVLDALQLHNVHLLGISYGGALAAEFARQFPARVRKLVLIAPGATVLGITGELMLRLMLATVSREHGLASLLRWLFADAAREHPEWFDATLEQLRLHMRSTRAAAPLPRVWTDAEWRQLTVPTLFLVGEHEKIYAATKVVEKLQRVAPEVRVDVVPGAGHDLTFLQAATINAKVLEFLREEAHAQQCAAATVAY